MAESKLRERRVTPSAAGVADDGLAFRAAEQSEDDQLSRILANAFLPVWNHNWFHGVTAALPPVPLDTSTALAGRQASRVRFYRAVIRIVRLLNGDVLVATLPASPSSNNTNTNTTIAAILLWLPPSRRLSDFDLLTPARAGMLSLLLPWHYGISGIYRLQGIFEANVATMFAQRLAASTPWRADECGFVQMIARNVAFDGQGCASRLLAWRVQRHFVEWPDRPVALDTTTAQGLRTYSKLGFELIGERAVDTGTDAQGIRLAKGASEKVKAEAKQTTVQRIMVMLPPEAGES